MSEKLSTQPYKGTRDFYPREMRMDPCPCGSGKKYKNCHGKAEN